MAMISEHPRLLGWTPRRLMGIQFVATGSYLPERIVTNDELETRLGFDADWILQRSGIQERRHAAPEMATSDMSVAAARVALDKAGVRAADVDLLIVATATPDHVGTSTACLVQNKLEITAPAFDLTAACGGFVYAAATAAQFVSTGASQLALVIGADCMSRIIDPFDQGTYPLFGDGAGAVLMAAGSGQQGLLSYALGADGAGQQMLYRPVGGSRIPPEQARPGERGEFLKMDGRAVFRWAVHALEATVSEVLSFAELDRNDVDLYVLHQANIRILQTAADHLGIDLARLFVNLDRYGNTTAGTIPIALDEAWAQDRIRRGQTVVISGFGAGLTWGTAAIKW
ncbi:MAG: ketoacyl-ACP synthase III [Planctomycetaceae bacterium]|nr:ketoacyl-ACP synthase III [Planctomycetaceae bacterium]